MSSIPMIDELRGGRLIRLIRLIRIIKAFNSTTLLINHLYRNRINGTLVSTTLLSIVLIIFSSIAILVIENDPNSNISTAEDAIWWTFCTISTVGYGDKYPVTTEGRILAIILMTYGVALLGIITAFVTSFFISPENKQIN